MPTCTVDDALDVSEGDALCLVGWDAGNSRPKVARASRAKLATSKTVFGVAVADATDTNPVVVRVGGEVVDTSIATGLPAGAGAGTSRIVATDITADNPDPALAAMAPRRPTAASASTAIAKGEESGGLGRSRPGPEWRS